MSCILVVAFLGIILLLYQFKKWTWTQTILFNYLFPCVMSHWNWQDHIWPDYNQKFLYFIKSYCDFIFYNNKSIMVLLGLLVSLVLVVGVKTEQRFLLLPWQVRYTVAWSSSPSNDVLLKSFSTANSNMSLLF